MKHIVEVYRKSNVMDQYREVKGYVLFRMISGYVKNTKINAGLKNDAILRDGVFEFSTPKTEDNPIDTDLFVFDSEVYDVQSVDKFTMRLDIVYNLSKSSFKVSEVKP